MSSLFRPKAAGVLNIISGVIHLFGAIFILIFGLLGDCFFNILWYGMLGTPLHPLAQLLSQELQEIVAISVIIGVLAMIGGIYGIKRKAWRLALADSICRTLLTWFLGIQGIILTVMFERKTTSETSA